MCGDDDITLILSVLLAQKEKCHTTARKTNLGPLDERLQCNERKTELDVSTAALFIYKGCN